MFGQFFLFMALIMVIHTSAYSQRDSLKVQNRRDTIKILNNKITKEILDAVTKKNQQEKPKNNVKSEDVFLRYEGRIIRRIIIRRTGFEKSIYDTTRSIKNTVTRLANSLHTDTREQVIRDNLFFKANRPLNPYLLADNERYLRDLDFILDSKIRVIPLRGRRDSVDIVVTTRDVFTLGFRARVRDVDKFSFGIYEANLMGQGQRIGAELLVEREREPVLGKSFVYTKSSLFGSLANLSAGYTELDNARSMGEENETAYFLRLDRPLVSPYSRMAGGMEISRNWSTNVYQFPDSLFRRYRYDIQDVWAGYNFGIKRKIKNRTRRFVGLRYNRQHFGRQPSQENYRQTIKYSDQQAVLAELIFYNQNFYKMNYIFGFGRTEDVPYGQTLNFTAGWASELGLDRIYVGSYAVNRLVRPSGRFYDLEIGGGTFINKSKSEDAVLYVSGAYYSKLYPIRSVNIRHKFVAGYSQAFNNRVRPLLSLNNELQGFRADSLYGNHRVMLSTETTVFTKWHFLGFRFAPFFSLEGAFLQANTLDNTTVRRTNDFFGGTSGGMRMRNENLIFGTVEFRAFYFPRTVPGVEPVSFKVTTNVRIKYSGSFVRPPEFVRYN